MFSIASINNYGCNINKVQNTQTDIKSLEKKELISKI